LTGVPLPVPGPAGTARPVGRSLRKESAMTKKAPHFMTMAAVLVFSTFAASAQLIKTGDNMQAGSTAEQKKAPESLRGPDGFTPQESSPANGGINVRSTTGQGSAASVSKLSDEQRSRIVSIFHDHKVAPANLGTPVHLGVQVPQSEKNYPVPPDVVEINPEWRGYNYIQIANEILIIDPGTREIVEIFQI
jgi:uncharacterized protein DUF1236